MDKREAAILLGEEGLGESFSRDDSILNYRPSIEFIEPPQVEDNYTETIPANNLTDQARIDTAELISGLNAIVGLADVAQKRIDDRVNGLGGVTIKLDPLKDQIAIAAMKRRFPEKTDPTEITYDDYKKAVECMTKHSPGLPLVTGDDIQAAKSDPLRTDFGGAANQNGENRPEISSPLNSIQPIDMGSFQKGALAALFAQLLPMILQQQGK